MSSLGAAVPLPCLTEILPSQFSSSIPGIVYAFLGTSRQLNVAPEAALSLLVGQAITELTHDIDPHSPHAEAMRFQISSVITLQVRKGSYVTQWKTN